MRGMAMAGVAAFALSGLGMADPAGADWVPNEMEPLEDCFGAPLPWLTAIYVPANSTGWTNGTAGDDVIIGTDGPELINGNGGNDTICAGRGDDWIVGNSGDDMIKGEGGADTIYGNDDNDFIIGDAGDDNIYGGDHDDYIAGQRGEDEIYGEDGIDALVDYGEASGIDDFDCGDDADTVILDKDIDQETNCETVVEYDGPTEDGE